MGFLSFGRLGYLTLGLFWEGFLDCQPSELSFFGTLIIWGSGTLLRENWTLMVGEGGGWAKITKIIMALFGNFMVELYLNNLFNGLIGFSSFGLV